MESSRDRGTESASTEGKSPDGTSADGENALNRNALNENALNRNALNENALNENAASASAFHKQSSAGHHASAEQAPAGHPASAEQDAREHLRILDEVVEKREAHAPPAVLLWLQLANGVLAALFVALWPFTLTSLSPVSSLLLVPLLITSGLLGGARERFRIRRGISKAHLATALVGLAGFIAGMAYTVLVGIPPLWAIVSPSVLIFVAIAARPALELRKAYASRERSRMVQAPLSPAARRTTIIIGAGLGLLAALSPFFLAGTFASMGVLLLVILGTLAQASSWSLHWVGFEWGPTQWAAFGVSVVALAAVAVVTLLNGRVLPVGAIVTGCGVLTIMVFAALRPPAPAPSVGPE